MNWKLLLSNTLKSLLSWRLVTKEVASVIMVWGGYLIIKVMLQEPGIKDALPDWVVTFTANLFWPTVAVSAAIAWLTIVPLYLMGFSEAAKIAIFIANASTVLYAIGFAFHGGNVRAVKGS